MIWGVFPYSWVDTHITQSHFCHLWISQVVHDMHHLSWIHQRDQRFLSEIIFCQAILITSNTRSPSIWVLLGYYSEMFRRDLYIFCFHHSDAVDMEKLSPITSPKAEDCRMHLASSMRWRDHSHWPPDWKMLHFDGHTLIENLSCSNRK